MWLRCVREVGFGQVLEREGKAIEEETPEAAFRLAHHGAVLAQRRDERDQTVEEYGGLRVEHVFQLPDADLQHDGRNRCPEAGTTEDFGVADGEHALLFTTRCDRHRPQTKSPPGALR